METKKSTARPPSWTPVDEGQPIGMPCEGGFTTVRAPERGVRFNQDGRDSLYIPESMIGEVMKHLKKRAR